MGVLAIWQKIYKTLASLRTGISLLIATSIFAALGTFILQRPATDPAELQRAYSPTTLAILDRLGLTDVFHVWWFTLLMVMVCISIICASLERWPNVWRFYARPYRRPEPHFRAVLPHHTKIPVADTNQAITATERAFANLGLKPERVVDHDEVSIYSERHRFSVLAAYVIHASLLLMFAGWIVDSTWGYRGYVQITAGESADKMELRVPGGPVSRPLGFTVRCDATGQENYADGTPRKWWSDLVILENGKEVKRKTIVVNDPLDHRGIRFFQANFGMSDKLESLILQAAPSTDITAPMKTVTVPGNGQKADVDSNTSIRVTRFVPDYYVQDGEIYTKSRQPRNPAFELAVTRNGQESKAWLMPAVSRASQGTDNSYTFLFSDMKMANYTGLEASFQPGQWGIWIGTILMAIGLFVAFFMVHMRFWAIVVKDENQGLVLWVGGAFNKNRDRFEERYNALIAAIKRELGESDQPKSANKKDQKAERETTLAGV